MKFVHILQGMSLSINKNDKIRIHRLLQRNLFLSALDIKDVLHLAVSYKLFTGR